MSKIYNKYIKLKSNNDKNTLYLFKYGIFFIFIDEDAIIISNLLKLKLTHLNENIVKCGFPSNSLNKYLSVLKNTPYNIQIVNTDSVQTLSISDYIHNEDIKKIIQELIDVNIDSLSISQAFELLSNTQKSLIGIFKENGGIKIKWND